MHMDDRARRREIIREVLSRGTVANQEQLAKFLADRGVRTTQTTLSRDFRAMGVVKGPDGYVLPESKTAPETRELARTLSTFVTDVTVGGTIVVLSTGPGHAQIVALELDRGPPDGVIGTVAGDDTIFVATRSAAAAKRVGATLREESGMHSVPRRARRRAGRAGDPHESPAARPPA
jgi:transcriptional regulator of arginine metabolism